jgi:hypothetical protein
MGLYRKRTAGPEARCAPARRPWHHGLLARAFAVSTLCLILGAGDPALARSTQIDPRLTPIYVIQGDGAASPLAGRTVDTAGMITGVTDDGFFLQDPLGDGNPATSDGLFVYTRTRPTLAPGTCVRVQAAQVEEFYAKTELNRAAAIVPESCAGPVTAARLPLPGLGQAPAPYYEPFEGMLVKLPALAGVVQGPTRRYAGGEHELALLPAHVHPYVLGRVFHDDAVALDALIYLSDRLGAVLPAAAFGARVAGPPEGLAAVFDYSFGKYQLLPLPGQAITGNDHRPAPTAMEAAAADEFTVCSFNLYGLGQAQYPDAAVYAEELDRRARVIAETLQGCTVLALQETGAPADAERLTAALTAGYDLAYQATALPGPATAEPDFPLTNSLLTRTDRVEVAEAALRQGCGPRDYGVNDPGACPAGQFPLFDRPPLLARLHISGAWPGGPVELWLIDNHWKSKTGDETANAVQRMAQARHVATLVQGLIDQQPGVAVVVAGDLNDFAGAPAVTALAEGVQPALLQPLAFLPALDRYTYVFNGAAQLLDHILITPDLGRQLAGVAIAHINADFPVTAATPRASDHDPVIVRLRPAGAVAAGGNLGFGGIQVTGVDAAGAPLATAVSDAAGDYRLWGLPPGALTLHFVPPPAVALRPAAVTWSALPGYQLAPAPQVHHQTALAAAVLAAATPELARRLLTPARPTTP